MPHLGRSGLGPDKVAGWPCEPQPSSQLPRQELSLIEPPLPEPVWVERHGQGPGPREALNHEALSQEERQGGRQPSPALVLEALDRQRDGTLVSHRRAQS